MIDRCCISGGVADDQVLIAGSMFYMHKGKF